MADKIEIEVIAKGLDAAKKDIEGLQKSMEKTAKDGSKSANILQSAWVKAAAGITVAVVGLKKAFDFGKEGAKIQQSMEATAQQFGVNVDKMVKKLREASAGTVSNANLIESANRAMALNVTKDMDKMSELLEVARARAKAMGIDTTQAFSDIVTGIGRQSPLILDNLGIITKGWAEEAKAAGKAFDAQFILNKVLKDGADIVKRSNPGVLTMAERLAKVEASAQNAGDALKRAFSAELVRIIEELGTQGENALDGISNNIENLRKGFRALFGSVYAVIALLRTIAEPIAASINSAIAIVQGFTNILKSTGDAIIGIGEAADLVSKGKFPEAWNLMKTNVKLTMDEIKNETKLTADLVSQEFARSGKTIKESWKTVADEYRSLTGEIGDLSVEVADKSIAENIRKLEILREQEQAAMEEEVEQKKIAKEAERQAEIEHQNGLNAIRQTAIQQSQAVLNSFFEFGRQKRATELSDFTAHQNEILQAEKEALDARTENKIKDLEKNKQLAINEARSRNADTTKIEEQYEQAKQDIVKTSTETKAEYERAAEERIRNEKRRTAKADKTAAIIQSIINTSLGITKALSSVPPPASYILAGITGTAGAVQTALIGAQPIPKFAQGTDFSLGGSALVGERGPEIVDLPQGSRVRTNDELTKQINDNRNISITVQTQDPITFVNELKQTYGLDVFQEA
jgi:hypothetical protein